VEDQQRGVQFLPGQWLDVHIPGLIKAGGFTITSTPNDAQPQSLVDSGTNEIRPAPFLELAIQDSPSNPPAAWLWRAADEIVGKKLEVRVGGSFVWPPQGVDLRQIKRVVFIAGGVGINPLISILSHIRQTNVQLDHLRFMYATRISRHDVQVSKILFLPRLLDLFRSPITPVDEKQKERLELFFTGQLENLEFAKGLPAYTRFQRIEDADLKSAAGTDEVEKKSSLFYVCGPPVMTDHIVDFLRRQDFIDPDRVLCEKWW